MIARGIFRRGAVAALTALAAVAATQAMGVFNGLSLAILIGGALAVISMPTRARAQAASDRVASGRAPKMDNCA